jgi:hypothetical protein
MDTVTSLAVINNYLISGSKDKNLKFYAVFFTYHIIVFSITTFSSLADSFSIFHKLILIYSLFYS